MRWAGALAGALCLFSAAQARAFCGFFVSGADAKLFNSATSVVLARKGTHTVLSMQNNYRGPPEDFAVVIPVPVVLSPETVRTLPRDVFDRVDALSAPRLVEYWEQDPCAFSSSDPEGGTGTRAKTITGWYGVVGPVDGVTVEAQFVVGEYEIVILGAEDALGLDTWLRTHGYRIPEGAAPVLRPYVESGSKFFVAKVDASKVELDADGAVLSPLRFEYHEEAFRLPVRLGLINSAGTQDLIVHVLADQRYDVANYESAFIPTNVEVDDATRARFGEFYAALFDATLARNRGAVVTEYAWDAASCDPCPGPTLKPDELRLLGAPDTGAVVHTRLHARYTRESLGEDLVFRAAPPIQGGREGDDGGARPAPRNTFQARYIIRHPWTGPVPCKSPSFGHWGDPPSGRRPVHPARDLANAERGRIDLPEFLREPVPSLDLPARAVRSITLERGDLRFGLGILLGAAIGLLAALGLRRIAGARLPER